MIIDYDINSTIGHGRGYPTGLEHEEKMDVIACLLDEGHWMNHQQWNTQLSEKPKKTNWLSDIS